MLPCPTRSMGAGDSPAPMRSPCKYIYIYTYIYKIILCFRDSVRSFFSSRPKYAIRGTGFLGQIASFERRLRGRLQRPSPCRVRSAHRRERGRMPSDTGEKFQKYRMSRRNSGDFGCILMSAAPGKFTKLASFPNGSW